MAAVCGINSSDSSRVLHPSLQYHAFSEKNGMYFHILTFGKIECREMSRLEDESMESIYLQAVKPNDATEPANSFIRGIRDVFLVKGINPRISVSLPEEARGKIRDLVEDMPSLSKIFAASTHYRIPGTLLTRFEGMTEDTGGSIPDELRPEIARILLEDLTKNIDAFGCAAIPQEMIRLTLLRGSDFSYLPSCDEFAHLRNRNAAIFIAVHQFPHDPLTYLREVQATQQHSPTVELVGRAVYARPTARYS